MGLKKKHIAVCERYCEWYKPGEKEEMACYGLSVVDKLDAPGIDLDKLPAEMVNMPEEFKKAIEEKVCSRCDWRVYDCDYSNPAISSAAPCGGVTLLALMMVSGEIDKGRL